MESIILIVVSFILLFLGVPIGIAMGLGILALLLYNPILPSTYLAQSMYSGMNIFPLLAIPAFMIAGAVMDTGGLSKRLINVANMAFGSTPGSLGNVTVMACLFFGAISGSSPATVAAIGSIMVPEMVKAGYGRGYATGLVAVAGGLGIIMPPSIPLVIYGSTNGVSIGDLFLAGVGPAILNALVLIVFNIFMCKKKGYQLKGQKFNLKKLISASYDGIWALFMPILILGGIYGGVFTPTEAAIVSLVYSIIIGRFVYKELKWKNLWDEFFDHAAFLGGMMFTFAPIAAMGAIFVYLDIQTTINTFMYNISENPLMVLLLVNLIMLVVGMFINTTPTMIILSPLLLGVVAPLGVNPIHFGIVLTMILEIAFVTPPVANNLFVASSMTGIDMVLITKYAIPFLIALFIVCIVVSFFPQISLFILN